MKNQNEKVISQYKKAWEEHNPKILRSLFAKNAVYFEKHNNIFNGIDEIIEYWNRNSEKQKDVLFTPLEWVSESENLIIRWKSEFFHVKKEKMKYLEGIMWIKMKNQKIQEFVEFFDKRYE